MTILSYRDTPARRLKRRIEAIAPRHGLSKTMAQSVVSVAEAVLWNGGKYWQAVKSARRLMRRMADDVNGPEAA